MVIVWYWVCMGYARLGGREREDTESMNKGFDTRGEPGRVSEYIYTTHTACVTDT